MTNPKINLKELAMNIFDITDPKPAKCNGEHEICLNCAKCRANDKDLLPNLENPLASFIDHTILKADATRHQIKKLCSEADEYGFASVCVNPTNMFCAYNNLEKAELCVVIGFPLGANSRKVKVIETQNAVDNNVHEIDMVINIGELKNKEYDFVLDEIKRIAKICTKNKVVLKVILENCYLNKTEIAISSLLSKKAGADYVKTSTGFGTSGAKVEDVALMRKVVGPKMGVKAAGGIHSKKEALDLINAGANRLGASKGIDIINEK